MDSKSTLLEQLRIERSPPVPVGSPRGQRAARTGLGDPRVLPQMGARVSFLADAPAAGLAVQIGSDSSTGTAFVIDGNRVAGRPVRLGARSGENQWILSGLPAGASVAIEDLSKLHDGVRVRITQ